MGLLQNALHFNAAVSLHADGPPSTGVLIWGGRLILGALLRILAKSLKQFFFCFIGPNLPWGLICWHCLKAGLSSSAAKTGDTVMSVNPNKHKMNAQVVILNL
jgi:hypothetical protein